MKLTFDFLDRDHPKYRTLTIWAILSFLVILSAIFFFQKEKNIAYKRLKMDATDVSIIKVRQFEDWHKARLADVQMFSQSPFFVNALCSWVKDTLDTKLMSDIVKRLSLINLNKQYTNILIVDLNGNILLNHGDTINYLDNTTKKHINDLVKSKQILFTNFYRCETHKTLHIDYMAPITTSGDVISAIIVFRVNPYQNIYPIIEKWPTPIETAKNYIVRKDGDSLLILNSIWSSDHNSLSESIQGHLKVDEKQKVLPNFLNVNSSNGENKFFYLSPIKGASWIFVKEIDYNEIYGYYRVSIGSIILITLLLLTFLSFAMLTYYFYLRRTQYVKMLVDERQLSGYYKEFQTILYSIGDGVITTDMHGCVTKMNFIAENIIGCKENVAFGLPIQDVIGSKNDAIIEATNDVLINKVSIASPIKTSIIDRHGIEKSASINASPIFDEKDKIKGVVLIIHDNTQEYESARRIHESEERYRMLFNNMTQGFALHDIILDEFGNPVDYKFVAINEAFERLTGFDRNCVVGKTVLEIMPKTEKYWIEVYGNVALTGEPLRYENYSTEIDKYFDVWAFCPQKGQFAVVFSDITERRKVEEEVKRKNEFIQTILDNLPIGVALNSFDDGNATYMNKKFEEIYGWSKEELKDTSAFFEKVYPDEDYRSALVDRIMTDIKSGDTERMKWNNIIVTHKDGSKKMVNAVNIPLIQQNTMVSTVMDISEIKKAEEAIRESEELFRSMFYDSFAIMLIIDPVSRQIVDANQAAERFYGWSKEEIQKMRIDDINTLPTSKLEKEILNVLTQKRIRFNFQHRLNGGNVREVEVLCSKITIKGKNYLHSIVNDVTEKRRADEQIQKLTRGIEQSPSIVMITDIKGNIEYVNPKFVEVTGYSIDEAIGQNPRFLKSGNQSEAFYRELWESILAGNDWRGEMINKKKNGELYWESTIISSIKNDNGKIKHFIAVKEDITERKQTELALQERDFRLKEQNEEYLAINEELTESNERIRAINKELVLARERAEENDRLKSAFLANMSHELRTPMNGIIGFAELLKRPQMNDEDRINYTKIIEQSGQRLLELINNLIDISKIEAGQVKASFSLVDVKTELEHLYNFFKLEAEGKGICLLLQGGEALPDLTLQTDKQKFISVITNLIKNSIKFTTRGTIDFGFDIGQNEIQFWVSDTGMGIPKRIQSRIFERFVQGDTSLSRPYEGAGLGLAISKSYVEILGGKIGFDSEENVGTTFRFTLPINYIPIETFNTSISNSRELDIMGKQLNVLIAEDDNNSMIYLQNLLEPYVRKIYCAETGQKTVEIAQKKDIDLILMDVRMPDINGLEVTKMIRKNNPRVRIIAQTAFALSEDKYAAIAAGCNDYIVKPILPNDLYQAILNCFDVSFQKRAFKIKN